MDTKKKIIAGLIALVIFGGGVGSGKLLGNSPADKDNPGKGKGKAVKEENYTFAGNAQLLGVDLENRSIAIFADLGSYTIKDFKNKQGNAVVDEGAEIFIGDDPATLEDISNFERIYIFGRQKGGEIHVNKILVPYE